MTREVPFDDEIEVRFDYADPKAFEIKNVFNLPDGQQGSWISAEDARKAWEGK